VAAGRSRSTPLLDAALATLLLAGTAGYWALLLPRVLGAADEGGYLYQALRVAAGDVLYRDVFNINPPGSYWFMAALFRLFGACLGTARWASAAVGGLTAALAYVACRRIDVRPGLALAAGLCQPALFQLAWPYASAHWLATCLVVALVLVLVGGRAPTSPARALAAGVVVGVLAAVHHHKAAVVAAGVVVVLAGEAAAASRAGARPRLAAGLVAFVAGIAAIVVPVAAVIVARAGPRPVFEALFVQVAGYGGAFSSRWGEVSILSAPEAAYTHPALLRWLPVLLVAGAVRVVVAWRGRAPLAAFRATLVLLVVPAAATVSILYFPDFVHIAVIGILFAMLAAHLLEGALGWLASRTRAAAAVGAALTALLVLALGADLERHRRRAVAEFPYALATPFGRVSFRTAADAARIARLRGLVAADGQPRLLLSYPVYPALYLLTGTENPTRYVFLRPGYSPPAQLDEVIATMDRRAVPWATVVRFLVPPGDPVFAYLERRYEPVAGFDPAEGFLVLRRRP
jgi:hypothetical protein